MDVGSLLTLMLVSVLATAAAVAAVMGFAAGTAARWVVAAGLVHAAAWGSFLLAAPIHDRGFSTLWIGLLGVSFACMWRAVCCWTGRQPCKRVLAATLVLTPLGYGLGFENYPFRVGWSNAGLCIAMALVCVAALQRAPHVGRRWRGVLVAGLGPLAAITLARGILGAFFTASYPELRTPHPVNVAGALLGHVALALTTLAFCLGWREETENALRARADTDPLTGLLNRRAWLERAEQMLSAARRYGESVALLLLDVDHFKRLNDTLGHQAGDEALTAIGRTLAREIRAGDLACRWGGEEFCVLVRHAAAAEGRLADARLRRSMAREFAGTPDRAVTFSSGLAVFGPELGTIAELIRSADAALYRAKALGRGRLIAADTPAAGIAEPELAAA
nr:GGDEF domain-containing protein [Schlegelella koreensis]